MEKRKLPLALAVLPVVAVIFCALMSVTTWGIGMNLPILSGIIVAAIIGKCLRFTWAEMQQSLVDGISRALPAFFVLLIVGVIIGSWIAGGVIPTLIFYSLKMINPMIFVPATAVVTGIVALSTGTSFTSIATVGLALMVTGVGMGFPAPLLAGAIISGAYLGDSMSPLSDTTNLASAMSGCNLFELIGHMMWTGPISFLIAIVGFYFVGAPYAQGVSQDSPEIIAIFEGLTNGFTINPLLLLIPIVTIFFSIKKFPAVPSLILIAALGGICAIFVQGFSVIETLNALTFGFKSNTEVAMLDNLLTRGGMVSMGGTIILMLLATGLGGILEKAGFLDVMLKAIMRFVKSDGQLVLVTIISGFVVAFATGAQLLAILLPARMFSSEYKERNISAKNLGRVAQTIGAIGINIVPWSVPCIFAANILDVNPIEFIPYIFFVYISVAINIIYGFTGFTITKDKQPEVSAKL